VVSKTRLTCHLTQEIRADEAQRDSEGTQSREIRRLNRHLATAEQERAAIREHLDDLRSLEDVTEEEEIQETHLYRELEQKRYVATNLTLEIFYY
jgi:hypothetical protein